MLGCGQDPRAAHGFSWSPREEERGLLQAGECVGCVLWLEDTFTFAGVWERWSAVLRIMCVLGVPSLLSNRNLNPQDLPRSSRALLS